MDKSRWCSVLVVKKGRLFEWRLFDHEELITRGLARTKTQAKQNGWKALRVREAEYPKGWAQTVPVAHRSPFAISERFFRQHNKKGH